MPLARAALRNEFGLGSAELYRESSCLEDPKGIFDSIAVSGLIGLLRQLGDLAEFAADVFHELQEQIVATSSRSRKLLARVHIIESSFPPLEKAVFSQKSHIHFAYVAGCDWHPRLRKQKHFFSGSELPGFIMDSYEECRLGPRLDMLDKFDDGGTGSCLKRYSDPSFHRRISNGEGKKPRKPKKKRSSHRSIDSCSSSTSRLSECLFTNETRNGAVAHLIRPLKNNSPLEESPIPQTPIQNDGESIVSRNSAPNIEQDDYVDAPNTIDSEPDHDIVLSSSTFNVALEPCTLPPHQINEPPPKTFESVESIELPCHEHSSAGHPIEIELKDQQQPTVVRPMAVESADLEHSNVACRIAIESTDQDRPSPPHPIAEELTEQGNPTIAMDSMNPEQPTPPIAMWTNGGLLGLEPSKPPDSWRPNGVEVSRTFGSSFKCIDEHETEKTNELQRKQPNGCSTREDRGNSASCSPPLDRIKISFNPSCGFSLKLKFPDGDRPNDGMLFPSFQLVPKEKTSTLSDSDDDVFCTSSLYASDGRNPSDDESDMWEGEEERAEEEASRRPNFPDVPSVEEVTQNKEDNNFDVLKQIKDKSCSLRRAASMPNGRSSAPSNDTVVAILKKADAIRKAVEIRDKEDDDATWSDS